MKLEQQRQSAGQELMRLVVPYIGMLVALALLVVVFSGLSKNFVSVTTITTVANRIPDLTVVAVGMTLILVVGGIDLSVGSILALSAAMLGYLMVDRGWTLLAATPVCIAVGGLCGWVNGLISFRARIPSFIVTLGMLEMARGGAYLITDSQTKYIGSSVEWLGTPIAGWYVSPAFVAAIALVFLAQFVLSRTVFGRYCVAIGANVEAARVSGIRTARYSIVVFVICGCLCGLAGLMQSSRLSSADPNGAVGLELSAIAACVIGGTSLMGGRGSVIHTFFGVLFIELLQTGLAQVGASDPAKRVVTGVVIVAAVLLDVLRQRWASRPLIDSFFKRG